MGRGMDYLPRVGTGGGLFCECGNEHSSRDVLLTTHPLLVPRSWKNYLYSTFKFSVRVINPTFLEVLPSHSQKLPDRRFYTTGFKLQEMRGELCNEIGTLW